MKKLNRENASPSFHSVKKNWPSYFHLLFIFQILTSPSPNLVPLEKGGDLINGKGIVLTWNKISVKHLPLHIQTLKKVLQKTFLYINFSWYRCWVWKFDQLANFVIIKINCKVWFNDSQFVFYDSSWSFHES